MHAKALSGKILEKGYSNDKFTLPHLISIHKLGLIVLPPKFKLKPELVQNGTTRGILSAVKKKQQPIR
jgi:hypothetical protein